MTKELTIKDRFWYVTIKTYLRKMGKQYKKMKPEDYEMIKCLFEESEGSWKGLAEGSLHHWGILRVACKTFLKVKKDRKERPFSPDENDGDDETSKEDK